ncbi:phosphatase PAP2 family protein [Cohnella hongkongensis]|uniref:Phosphatase PAP2 family protein n=1 Tax=Cohnella hongkongensis TaxID=178337 RepID=A0ABV9FKJ4_9BACL
MKEKETEKFYRRAYSWASLAVILFIVVSWLVSSERTAAFDSRMIGFIQGLETPAWTRAAEFASLIGSTAGVILLLVVFGAGLAAGLGHRKELLLLVFSVGGAAGLNSLLKNAFQRERPALHRLAEETGYSFPSGHSMAAFALYGAMAYLLWRHIASRAGRTALIAAAAVLVLSIGLSRIYLGVHYPSDVLAGYLASLVWLGLGIELFRGWLRKERR